MTLSAAPAPTLTIDTYASKIDDAEVLEIHTVPETGRLRVFINDSTMYDADPANRDERAAVVAAVFAQLDDTTGDVLLEGSEPTARDYAADLVELLTAKYLSDVQAPDA